MILKHVRTWNQNMTKYSKIWANGRKKVSDDNNCKVIPWIALSKSSDQKRKMMLSRATRVKDLMEAQKMYVQFILSKGTIHAVLILLEWA